ncbi:MAG: hypothetical protein ACOC41_07395 [Chitinivibrionales bacterium]
MLNEIEVSRSMDAITSRKREHDIREVLSEHVLNDSGVSRDPKLPGKDTLQEL